MVSRHEKPVTAKAEETRERIVDAALELFRKQGFDETTMRDIVSQFAEHRRLLIALARIGIDPANPLSPFGKETQPMRDESVDAFRVALRDSNVRIPKDLQADLPRLLWLYMMGVILFWIFDDSPEQARTRTLLDGTLDLIVRLIRLSSLPLMGPLRRRLLHTIRAATI